MLESVVSLARQQLGADADKLIAVAPRDARLATWLWDAMALARPEAFGLTVSLRDTTPLSLALRYAQLAAPTLVAPLVLTVPERAALAELRALVVAWTGLNTWTPFEHLVFDPRCLPLAETFAAACTRSGGGVAFTFHPTLDRVALYPQRFIAGFRRQHGLLVAVLMHEETHLAAALAVPGARGLRGSAHPWENAAQLVQHVSYLTLRNGHVPPRSTLAAYLDRFSPRPARFVAAAPRALSVPGLVARAVSAAVAAIAPAD